ncbi:MAG: epoxyqueuosine reductase [Candidatus Lokiarchaeota archaeon]|nr:epoxyqueuosine reductase [Candidatus Lokiarchaeota archaeon]
MTINKEWFIEKIQTFLAENAANKMVGVDGSPFYRQDILLGIVSGDDQIFEEYKSEIIGSFHMTPREAVEIYCKKKKLDVPQGNLSVIAYILPFNQDTRKENLEYSKEWPSVRWAHTRLYGEKCNVAIQQHIIDELEKEGIFALAPMMHSFMWKILKKHEKGVWASKWSHRHMCFAAGLGSFGLSDGFMNEKGVAMRCGSLIVALELPSDADKRPSDPYALCSKCGTCIKRCPVGAIAFDTGHDKQRCSEMVMSTIPYIKDNYNIPIYSCGLCQVGVPCQDGLPVNKK